MMTEELVRAAAAGDQDAFAQLVRLYENKVYSLGLDAADSGPGPQEAAEGAELRRAVAAGLARLSDDHRQVLVLRELQELSYEEIARMLDIDLGDGEVPHLPGPERPAQDFAGEWELIRIPAV